MLRHLDLFAGIGAVTLSAQRLGGLHSRLGKIQTKQLVELDPDAQKVLRSHFNIPIYPDIQDYCPTPGEFDLITMGFPALFKTGLHFDGKSSPRTERLF